MCPIVTNPTRITLYVQTSLGQQLATKALNDRMPVIKFVGNVCVCVHVGVCVYHWTQSVKLFKCQVSYMC